MEEIISFNKMFKVIIITIFPEMFPGLLNVSIIGKALNKKLWHLSIIDLKKYAINGKKIDDIPFGGGPGMIIRPDVLQAAYDNIKKDNPRITSKKFAKIVFSPRGITLNQNLLLNFSKLEGMVLVCGRYEGLDERFIEKNNFQQVSLGNFVLMGGEIASMATLEGVIRLLPGVLGNKKSLEKENFNDNFLEYPQYTRPRKWQNIDVPAVLLSGNHKEIIKWRKKNSQIIFKKK